MEVGREFEVPKKGLFQRLDPTNKRWYVVPSVASVRILLFAFCLVAPFLVHRHNKTYYVMEQVSLILFPLAMGLGIFAFLCYLFPRLLTGPYG